MQKTKRVAVRPDPLDLSLLKACATLLLQGEVIAFPTETVYGLGADAFSEKGVEKIFQVKGRSFQKPLSVMISNRSMVEQVARDIRPHAKLLMQLFWPGPLTLVLNACTVLSPRITAGTSKIGVRFPDHPVPVGIVEALGRPIVATSANLSGKPSPTTAGEVLGQLKGKISLVLDGGKCKEGNESTVIDCTGEDIVLLREGVLPFHKIRLALS